MVATPSWLAAAAAVLPLLSIANAELTQELRDRKLPNCDADIKFNEIEDKGSFWYDSGAEQFADDYINSNTDHTKWAQHLFRELLPKEDYTQFDCETTGATCKTPFDLCEKLNAIDKGGLYYLYISLRHFHTYMAALEKDMNDNFLQSALKVSQIQELLNLPNGDSDSTPDVLSILSYAAGIGAGFAGPASGAVGAVSGVIGILGTVNPSNVVPDQTGKANARIDGMIDNMIEETNNIISRLVGAVFGRFGQSQDVIPDEMRRGGVENPAVQVFGWGDWLREDSNTEAAEKFAGKFKEKANQSLLWQMGRLYKKIFVVVRTDLPQDKCTNPNNAWDDEKSRCLDLLSWDGGDWSTLGGANDLTSNDMWKAWNMDPFWTMRNAVDCWEDNDGKIGDAKPSQVWESSVPPPCFFAMEVVKGTYSDSHKGMIKLSGDFPGQDGLEDKMWPKSKCEDASEFERGAYACEYDWVGDE